MTPNRARPDRIIAHAELLRAVDRLLEHAAELRARRDALDRLFDITTETQLETRATEGDGATRHDRAVCRNQRRNATAERT